MGKSQQSLKDVEPSKMKGLYKEYKEYSLASIIIIIILVSVAAITSITILHHILLVYPITVGASYHECDYCY